MHTMGTHIKMWEITSSGLSPITDTSFAAAHAEAELEQWLAAGASILGEDLLVIAKQLTVKNVGRLDLLCIDATGALVIVELKRDQSPRETVAQALDYASWLDSADAEVVEQAAGRFLHKPLQG